jgi:hypothetical protein
MAPLLTGLTIDDDELIGDFELDMRAVEALTPARAATCPSDSSIACSIEPGCVGSADSTSCQNTIQLGAAACFDCC